MISSQTRQYISGFDEIIQEGDVDFRDWIEGHQCNPSRAFSRNLIH